MQIQLHILWFENGSPFSSEKGQTVLRLECDLLRFAKRLFHQLGQLEYQEGHPVVPRLDYQNLQEAIVLLEHAKRDKPLSYPSEEG